MVSLVRVWFAVLLRAELVLPVSYGTLASMPMLWSIYQSVDGSQVRWRGRENAELFLSKLLADKITSHPSKSKSGSVSIIRTSNPSQANTPHHIISQVFPPPVGSLGFWAFSICPIMSSNALVTFSLNRALASVLAHLNSSASFLPSSTVTWRCSGRKSLLLPTMTMGTHSEPYITLAFFIKLLKQLHLLNDSGFCHE